MLATCPANEVYTIEGKVFAGALKTSRSNAVREIWDHGERKVLNAVRCSLHLSGVSPRAQWRTNRKPPKELFGDLLKDLSHKQ